MSGDLNAKIESILNSHRQIFIGVTFSLILLRVFFFSAAFPFFNNVDEQAHFDAVVKYSKRYLQHKENIRYEYESAELIVLYGSPEYMIRSTDFKSKKFPPPFWSVNRKQISPYISSFIRDWTERNNIEAFSPPVYYTFAGVWYNFGKMLDLKGGHLLYWIRFLNIPIIAILYWVTYLFCRNIYRNDIFIQTTVLLLLTFFPQDTFYSINSDVFSTLFYLVSLYLLMQIYNSDKSLIFHLVAGIMVAAAFLVKYSNISIFLIMAVLVILKLKKLNKYGLLKEQICNLLFLVSGSLIPVLIWLGWCAHAFGDITGTAEKVRHLGWTIKPFLEIWDHPIFSLRGSIYFFTDVVRRFWRGEFIWEQTILASEKMDSFYFISSCIFIFLSIANLLISKKVSSSGHRLINCINTLALGSSILLLAVFSIIYDFGDCFYPSRNYPFFTSSRLVLGALVPFLILYLDGLRILIYKINGRFNLYIIVMIICLLIAYSEVRMIYPILESDYNWFHLL